MKRRLYESLGILHLTPARRGAIVIRMSGDQGLNPTTAPRPRRLLRRASVAALGAMVLFLLGCPTVTVTDVQDEVVPLSGQGRLIIRNENGNVRLEPGSDSVLTLHMVKWARGPDEAECQGRLDDIQVTIAAAAESVLVKIDQPHGGAYTCGVHMELRLPRVMALDVSSTNGDLTGAGFTGAQKLMTTNGDITLARITGDLDVETTNGNLELESVQGSVDGQTTNGSVDVALVLVDTSHCRLRGTNGDISLAVPESTSARLYARTTNGTVHWTNLVLKGGSSTRQKVDATLGSGAGDIYITTTNGDITLTGY